MSTISSKSQFETTLWTEVLLARGNTLESQDALTALCEKYYEPVLQWLKKAGYDQQESAQDIAHDFFSDLLSGNRLDLLDRDKGRFRSYLLGALKHFLSHRRSHRKTEKRGGNADSFSLNEPGVDVQEKALPPDKVFDQQWAIALLGRALATVEEECREQGTELQFKYLSPFLTGEAEHGDQTQLAQKIGLPPATLRSAIHRLRRRFRAAVKAEIADTVTGRDQIKAEMNSLFAALGGGEQKKQ